MVTTYLLSQHLTNPGSQDTCVAQALSELLQLPSGHLTVPEEQDREVEGQDDGFEAHDPSMHFTG